MNRRRAIGWLLALTGVWMAGCGAGGSGGGGGSPPPPTAGSLKVVNSYNYPLTELYVSPAGNGNWGANQLSASVPVGGTFTLTNIPAGSYDLRVVASDGAHAETYAVSISAGGLYTWTITPSGGTGSLKVVNNYTYPITQLYVSPSSSSSWGTNQLSGSIPVGGTFTLTNIPVGSYDFKAVASDGAHAERYGTSITAGGLFTWTLTP